MSEAPMSPEKAARRARRKSSTSSRAGSSRAGGSITSKATRRSSGGSASASVPTGPPLATLALKLTRQDWSELSMNEKDAQTAATPNLDILVERVTALLLVRIVACLIDPGTTPDLSTTMICNTYIHSKRKTTWPKQLTDTAVSQLRDYVKRILSGYKEVPYHNRQHAYHVILSVNKLLDVMACTYTMTNKQGTKTSSGTTIIVPKKFKPPPSYGLRHDPIAMFALVFAALIHDVEHQGIPNRQLASENDRLAVLYNDQSIAENWSLYIAFSELLQDEFAELRQVLFGSNPESTEYTERYQRFRKMVVSMVLSTDLASPERTQVGKSKWKEAFGEPHETVEAKLKRNNRRLHQQQTSSGSGESGTTGVGTHEGRTVFRRSTQDSAALSEMTTSGNSDLNDLRQIDSVDEGDESLSGTPDQSENSSVGSQAKSSQSLNLSPIQSTAQRLSTLSSASDHPSRAGNSLNHFLNRSHHRFESRMTRSVSGSMVNGKFRQRLGILRTVDLGGQTLETYSRHDKNSTSTRSIAYTVDDSDADEPDELKMTVVMETILAACDVAHNLQSWQHMLTWSNRLYLELRRAHVAGRGVDVSRNWYENQIGFLESYVLPLARRLEDTGVWGDETTMPGMMFSQTVEDMRDEWFEKGAAFTKDLIQEGGQLYPNN